MGKKDKIPHKKVKGTEMVYRSVSLPASLVEDLKLLKDSYEDAWKEDEGERERVTYEKIFERLLSKSGLGHVDPDVYSKFKTAKETRKEFPAVVTRATRNLVAELVARAERNGTTLEEEARKEQEVAKAPLKEDVVSATPPPREGKKTEKRFVHPDGRWYPAVQGDYDWVPIDPKTGRWMKLKPVKEEGFVLVDVEV